MADFEESTLKAKREYSQLLRLHERLLTQLDRVRADLTSPGTHTLLKTIRARTGSVPDLSEVISAVEEAIRSLKMGESEIRSDLLEHPDFMPVEGVANLPTHLQRFLAERAQSPGFSYEVVQDEVRGWMVRWKEYTLRGTIRGYGQFYERPYAWLED
jgi:hypothetical protein